MYSVLQGLLLFRAQRITPNREQTLGKPGLKLRADDLEACQGEYLAELLIFPACRWQSWISNWLPPCDGFEIMMWKEFDNGDVDCGLRGVPGGGEYL